MTTSRGVASSLRIGVEPRRSSTDCVITLDAMRMRLTRVRRPAARRDADAEIDGVGDEALLARLDRLDQAFAGERAAFDQRQAAAIEGQPGVVGQPHGTERLRHAARRAPQRHALDGDVVLDDRTIADWLRRTVTGCFQLVFEQLAERAARGRGLDAGHRVLDRRSRRRGRRWRRRAPARRRRPRPTCRAPSEHGRALTGRDTIATAARPTLTVSVIEPTSSGTSERRAATQDQRGSPS